MSGHEQIMSMAREGRGKVDKSIKPPRGFGPVDYVFERFQAHWRDEWRRRMVSQAGCEAIAAEWQHSLRPYAESDIRKAVFAALTNTMPPSCAAFVDLVEAVIDKRVEDAKPRDRELGRQYLQKIRDQYLKEGSV